MYDRNAVLQLLESNGIAYELTEHPAAFNMEEAAALKLPYPQDEAKNLFVRDDKKRNYFLITIRGNKRVDLKQFRIDQGTRPLSFASNSDLFQHLQLTPGSVNPLGLVTYSHHLRCRLEVGASRSRTPTCSDNPSLSDSLCPRVPFFISVRYRSAILSASVFRLTAAL